jgi:hypothetical protein
MFHDYKRALQEAIIKGRNSGKVIRRSFNKTEFAEQFPEAVNDPRFLLLPDNFIFDVSPLEQLTVKELREICLEKPDHPLSIRKRTHIIGLPDDTIVVVLQEDLDILRQGEQTVTAVVPEVPTPKKEKSVPTSKSTTVPTTGIISDIVDDPKKKS